MSMSPWVAAINFIGQFIVPVKRADQTVGRRQGENLKIALTGLI